MKTFGTRLSDEESTLLEDYLSRNNLRKAEYIRNLILKDLDKSDNNCLSQRDLIAKSLEFLVELKMMAYDNISDKKINNTDENRKEYLGDIKKRASNAIEKSNLK